MIVESYEDVVMLSGALVSNQWSTLHTALSLQLQRHPEGVIIDCSGLTQMNEAGADTFYHVMQFLHQYDARVIVAALPQGLLEIVRRVPDVRSQLPMARTLEEARNSLYLLSDGELSDHGHGSKKKKGNFDKHLLVCLSGTTCDQYLLETAVQMADGLNADVHLLYPIQVPREMPINAPLPSVEKEAKAALDKAEELMSAQRVAHSMSVERGRDAVSAVQSAIEESVVDYILFGLPSDDSSGTDHGKLVSTAMAKLDPELIFVRAPRKAN